MRNLVHGLGVFPLHLLHNVHKLFFFLHLIHRCVATDMCRAQQMEAPPGFLRHQYRLYVGKNLVAVLTNIVELLFPIGVESSNMSPEVIPERPPFALQIRQVSSNQTEGVLVDDPQILRLSKRPHSVLIQPHEVIPAILINFMGYRPSFLQVFIKLF